MEKGNNTIKKALGKAKDIGSKAITSAKTSAQLRAECTKTKELAERIKKYNPLFPEDYQRDNFKLPNVITIVDDAIRRDIDVCEGAIGWLSNEKTSRFYTFTMRRFHSAI